MKGIEWILCTPLNSLIQNDWQTAGDGLIVTAIVLPTTLFSGDSQRRVFNTVEDVHWLHLNAK